MDDDISETPHRRAREGNLIKLMITILIPPLGVFLKDGLRGSFWLNLLLTILGWLPGVAHGVYIQVRDKPGELK
ncbi:YqaE/Pmp3 family membrane protein [Pseudooceanicola sp. HF7]|nr:YqaE/Pmp3 family membrane protein [Pseudooceanicola sp. HF7]